MSKQPVKFDKDEMQDIIMRRGNGDPINDAELAKLLLFWDTAVEVVGTALNVFGKAVFRYAIGEQEDAHRVAEARKDKAHKVGKISDLEVAQEESSQFQEAIQVLEKAIAKKESEFRKMSHDKQCRNWCALDTYRKNIRMSIELLNMPKEGASNA